MIDSLIKLFKDLMTASASFWIEAFLIVGITLLFHLVLKKFLNPRNRGHKVTAVVAVWCALQKPMIFQIWLCAVFRLFTLEAANFGNIPMSELFQAFALVAIWGFVSGIALAAREVEYTLSDGDVVIEPWDMGSADTLRILVRIIVISIGLVLTAQMLGFSMSGLVALGGTSGIVIGFAAKDLVANFFGALMIRMDRPFSVGEWVRSPDRDIEGVVEDIGMRITRIRTFDQRPLYVPNSVFASIAIETPSRMHNRRIYETVGVRYDDAEQVKSVVDAVRDMLSNHEDIDHSKLLMVNLTSFGPSSLDFFIYTFTKTTDWSTYHKIKEDVMLKILNIIDSHNAQVAFPTQTLHINPEALPIDGIPSAGPSE